ncbi:Major facilitator [Trema orientale]|uniref:Major facilitator n=1 Tax=Trema orientale TaxID=63057 RepID=A0A2P5EMH7_TREOI|nr:Major facilitator [Trema orientale]
MAEEDRECNNIRESLLKKEYYYYPNCPGCKVEQYKDLQQGFPVLDLLRLWIIVLATALPISSLFPFLYFMIRDLNIAKREEDIGYYAGYVGESFDIGVLGNGGRPLRIIFNTLFGLSVNFWMAVTTRFLLGSLNGLLGPIKAYASELFREEHQAIGLSTVSTAWGIGLIIGPALGGFLAQETLHKHNGKNGSSNSNEIEALEAAEPSPTDPNHQKKEIQNDDQVKEQTSKKSLLKNWPLMSSIIVYCVFSLHDMAYSEIFSLWAVSPKKFGGLSYTTQNVGEVLAFSDVPIPICGKASWSNNGFSHWRGKFVVD